MKVPTPDLSAISEVDWARLAAYIDGEGCISIKGVCGTKHRRRIMYVDVTVTNTDYRLLAWLKATFGGSVSPMSKRGPRFAPVGKWNVASRQACDILRRSSVHYIVKREQVDLALAFQETILPDRRYGRSGRPAHIVEQQRAMLLEMQTLKARGIGRASEGVTVQ